MYDPDGQDDEPAYDWDAWEKNRFSGRSRWWLIWAVAMMVASTALYFSGNSWLSR